MDSPLTGQLQELTRDIRSLLTRTEELSRELEDDANLRYVVSLFINYRAAIVRGQRECKQRFANLDEALLAIFGWADRPSTAERVFAGAGTLLMHTFKHAKEIFCEDYDFVRLIELIDTTYYGGVHSESVSDTLKTYAERTKLMHELTALSDMLGSVVQLTSDVTTDIEKLPDPS